MHSSSTPTINYSQRKHLQELKKNRSLVCKASEMLSNPFDPKQISLALKSLETQTQRKQLLDKIIWLRNDRKRKQELERMSSMRGILSKASMRFAQVKTQEINYKRDFQDFKIIQEERNRMEKLQYENLNLQLSEKVIPFKRMSSLVFLTKDIDQKKLNRKDTFNPYENQLNMQATRKVKQNNNLLISTINRQIQSNYTDQTLNSPQNNLQTTMEADQE